MVKPPWGPRVSGLPVRYRVLQGADGDVRLESGIATVF